MTRRPGATIALIFLFVSATAPLAVAGGGGVERRIVTSDNLFAPQVARLRVGDTVVWTNRGNVAHEVSASDGSFTSGNIASGASYRRTFTSPGDVRYFCRYHGTTSAGMTGALRIVAAGVDLPGLPKTGGGRQVAAGVAVLLITAVVGAGLTTAGPWGARA